jgi:hypothetical protein
MYQREPALERAAGHLFGILSRPKRAFIELNWPEPARSCQKVRKSPALGGIQSASELPPLKSSGEEL